MLSIDKIFPLNPLTTSIYAVNNYHSVHITPPPEVEISLLNDDGDYFLTTYDGSSYKLLTT